MKRRMCSLLLVLALMLGMLPTVALAAPTASNNVYQIGTAADLLWFAQQVNSGKTTYKAVLTKDIDLSGTADWPGIGTSANKFAGSFDGQNHTVTFKDAKWGLFGYVLGSEGALVTIQNVKTAGSIKASGFAHNAGYVQFINCINGATITSSVSYVAGILGKEIGVWQAGYYKSQVLLQNCGNTASITGASDVGGLVGWTESNTKLTGCFNTGNVHGAGSEIGGLVGYMQGNVGSCKVEKSYNTGRVTGDSKVGGIVGYMMNDTSVSYCYNSGNTTYAIAGSRFNGTAKFDHCYYLGVASDKCSPDYNETARYDETTKEIQTRATAKSAAEMATSTFASLMGSSFKQSCPTPVLSWQTAKAHTGSTSCSNCKLGSTAAEIYVVTFQSGSGFTLTGESTVTQGSGYSFTFALKSGYQKNGAFAVKVNGKAATLSGGKYSVTGVSGPLSITVIGVETVPGNYGITLPGAGNGYTVSGATSIKANTDYSMTVTFKDGFKAGSNFKVTAVEIQTDEEINNNATPKTRTLTAKNGQYVLTNVDDHYQIVISGVVAVSKVAPVQVSFTVTEGWYNFHAPNDYGEAMLNLTISVPYFDLSVYGLEKYYYNPYCYKDEKGNIRSQQQKGTPESAYDNITVMHAYIVATELFYFGVDPDDVGKGTINAAKFKEAISWSQDAGSSFMDFWDHGTNLNYYVNYKYPLAYNGWGSTSDQIKLKDGDVISVHLITGQGSGSDFGFFTVNDTNSKFNPGKDITDSITVEQGQKLTLTYFKTVTSGNYDTSYALQKKQQLYWISEDEFDPDAKVTDWNTTGFGGNTLKTDANGVVTIDTAKLEPGKYYIGAPGGFTAGSGADNAGFVSAGTEAGPAFFQIVVQEYNGKVGDLDGDTSITAKDASVILQYVSKKIKEINHGVADVDGDGNVTAKDASMILQYVSKKISVFPTAK